MFVSGLNFAAIYLIVIKAQFNEIKDEEMRNYFFIWVSSIALASGFMAYAGSSFSDTLRDTAFTLTSIITSTGYSTADWGSWQLFPKLILLILMAIGATAGSTSGGLKIMRATMLLKIARREIMTIVQPKRVVPIRVNGEVVDERRVSLAIGMICAWILLCTISILVLSFAERSIDLESAVSVIFSMLGNTGPALGAYGPTHTYASMSEFGLLGSSVLMWLGRLEILTVLILFNPRLWSKSN
jgi:trk system potassium uptake protein TrkH